MGHVVSAAKPADPVAIITLLQITMCSSLDVTCSQMSSAEASPPVTVLGGTWH